MKTIRYSSNSVDYTARRNVLRSLKDGEYIPTSVIQTVAIKIMLRYISFIFGVVSRMRIQFYIFYKKCSVRHERPNSTCCWARCARHNQTSIRRSEKIQGHPHLKNGERVSRDLLLTSLGRLSRPCEGYFFSQPTKRT